MPAPNVTVTIRKVRNASGLDLLIPSYSEKSQLLRSTVEFSVVAVSYLACFKHHRHKDDDVVQLMVTKKLEDFEELRRRLGAHFEGTLFPPLPQSLFSFVQGSAKDQVAILETFLQFIAESPQMSTSVEILQFLGLSTVNSGKKIFGRRQTPTDSDLLGEDSDREGNDLFVSSSCKRDTVDDDDDDDALFTAPSGDKTEHKTSEQDNMAAARLFDDQELGSGGVSRHEDLGLFASEPTARQDDRLEGRDQEEDNLLRIDEDLDNILSVTIKRSPPDTSQRNESSTSSQLNNTRKSTTAPKPPAKPAVRPKPSQKPSLAPKPHSPPSLTPKQCLDKTDKPKASSLFDNRGDSGLGSEDILNYIQENSKRADEDLDLFS